MVRLLWPASPTLRLMNVIVAAVIVFGTAMLIARWETLPKLTDMNIGAPPIPSLPVVQGEQWKPDNVQTGSFVKVADNERFTLLLDPATSQIAVLNKRSGYLWRSNPGQAQLSKETVKGTLLENLQSPYILEYIIAGNTRRIVTNVLDPKVSVNYILMGNGVQATYDYAELQLSFVIQYVLTDYGIELLIPDEGIIESGPNKFFAINPLPFFGAVSGTEEDGYLFVPDGPGGLIHYDHHRPAIIKGYEFPLYGADPANMKQGTIRTAPRETISYPVYGLTRGDQAYAAIVKEGKYAAAVKAIPSGIAGTYHSLSVNFKYREEYGRKVSGITGEIVNTMQKDRVQLDRRIEYRLLSGDEAGYVGMAHAYREYLEEIGSFAKALPETEHIPLHLSFIGGGTKPKFGGFGYEAATTFEQAEHIVEDLFQNGITNIRLTVQGWQNSGHMFTDHRFPVNSEIGGTSGAKKFVEMMHDKGIKVLFEDFAGWKIAKHSSFSVKYDGIRSMDSTVLQYGLGTNQGNIAAGFIVNPMKAVRKQKEVIDSLKKLGVDGLYYTDGPGNLLYSDFNPSSLLSRADTAYYYLSLLKYTRSELGTTGVYRGNDYTLGHTDFIRELPFESSYDLMIDETVPFYPMVIHGAVEYTSIASNLRSVYDDDFLRAVEYGAIPYYVLTYSPSRTLKDTDYEYIFSSEYAVWKDRITDEYRKFNQMAATYDKRMTNHHKLSAGVYVTTYEDGTKVTVDYNTKQFNVEKGGAK